MPMRILQLTKKFPYPLKDGESLAISYLAGALDAQGCELTLLSMNTCKHYSDPRALPQDEQHWESVHVENVDTRVRPFPALRHLIRKESYHIGRFVQDGFRTRLIALLREKEFDVIQLETLYLTPYIDDIRAHSNAIIALRTHNVEHEIWERMATNQRPGLKRWYLQTLSNQLKSFEISQLSRIDLLVAISRRDLDRFRELGYQGPAVCLPIGLDTVRYTPCLKAFNRTVSLAFIGSLDWMPNKEGLLFFLEEVWKQAKAEGLKVELHVAGRNMPPSLLKRKWEGVYLHGEVPDAKAFINEHAVMVVPLLSGSGMRAKILEGMALGRAVITTSLGLEGIEAEPGEEVLLADSAATFLKCLRYVIDQPEELVQIGRRARTKVLSEYDTHRQAKKLIDAYRSFLVEISS